MKKICFTWLLFLLAGIIHANNIRLASLLLNGQNTTSQYSMVNSGVSRENSWRNITNGANYEAAGSCSIRVFQSASTERAEILPVKAG